MKKKYNVVIAGIPNGYHYAIRTRYRVQAGSKKDAKEGICNKFESVWSITVSFLFWATLVATIRNVSSLLSRKIYNKLLPVYIPDGRRYTNKLHLAIWCCIDCKKLGSLMAVLKGTRITLRKGHAPIWVIKRGEV